MGTKSSKTTPKIERAEAVLGKKEIANEQEVAEALRAAKAVQR